MSYRILGAKNRVKMNVECIDLGKIFGFDAGRLGNVKELVPWSSALDLETRMVTTKMYMMISIV
jgi:hypothetical protein